MAARSNNLVKTTWPQAAAYRLWAGVTMLVGLGLLAHNLGLLPPAVMAVTRWWPALVLALGLWRVARPGLGFALPSFAVERAGFEGASLTLDSGFGSARLGPFAGSTQLAVGAFPSPAGPLLRAEASWARLLLDYRRAAPFISGEWQIQLAKTLPWTLDLRSLSGDVLLNLRDLNVAALEARSTFGDVDLALPQAGQGVWQVLATFGDVILRLPDGAAVKIAVKAGALANARIEDARFAAGAPGEWATPGFEAAPQRIVVQVALGAGDLRLL